MLLGGCSHVSVVSLGYSEIAIGKESFQMEGWESKNSFCRRYGHNWILTTADGFRRCDCSECGAVERFMDGKWVSVAQKVIKEKKGVNSCFIPVSLF